MDVNPESSAAIAVGDVVRVLYRTLTVVSREYDEEHNRLHLGFRGIRESQVREFQCSLREFVEIP